MGIVMWIIFGVFAVGITRQRIKHSNRGQLKEYESRRNAMSKIWFYKMHKL